MQKLKCTEFDKVKSSKFCLVDFSATWCGPCRMIKPILEEIASQIKDVEFFNIDVDDCPDIAKEYRVFSIPTLMIFKQGEAVDTLIGFVPQDEILEFINKNR